MSDYRRTIPKQDNTFAMRQTANYQRTSKSDGVATRDASMGVSSNGKFSPQEMIVKKYISTYFMNRLQILAKRIAEKEFTKLSIYYQGNVGYVSLRSPKDLNCLSPQMRKDLGEALSILQKDDNVYVIVIVSQLAKMFCVGADIKQMAKEEYESIARKEPIHEVQEVLRVVKKPVIAAINGKALGGGFELALMCDIIVSSDKSYFGFPEINLGLMPGLGGTQRLTKIVGEKRAMMCILCGGGFTAEEAFSLNLAIPVPSEKFSEHVQKIAQSISSKALMSLMQAKKSIKQASNMTLDQGLAFEKGIFYSLIGTKASKQGITAFLNKRKPNFKGL